MDMEDEGPGYSALKINVFGTWEETGSWYLDLRIHGVWKVLGRYGLRVL